MVRIHHLPPPQNPRKTAVLTVIYRHYSGSPLATHLRFIALSFPSRLLRYDASKVNDIKRAVWAEIAAAEKAGRRWPSKLLLSQIFRRISYSVESLGFKFLSHHPMTLLPEDIHDGPGEQADLLDQQDDRKTNLLQDAHGGVIPDRLVRVKQRAEDDNE